MRSQDEIVYSYTARHGVVINISGNVYQLEDNTHHCCTRIPHLVLTVFIIIYPPGLSLKLQHEQGVGLHMTFMLLLQPTNHDS